VANWVYQWYRPEGRLKADEIADRFVEMILTGFRA
ncbi:MAG: TetR/AcrR family transcriptional regulator, partial [Thermoactinomyces sp.]